MIFVVGAGPGRLKYLTLEAMELIKGAEYVIAFSRIGEEVSAIRKDIRKITRVQELLEMLNEIGGEKNIVILASGDPNFFGIVELLKRNDLLLSHVSPGISSVQYMFSKLQKPYSHVVNHSVHGRDFDFTKLCGKTHSFLVDSEKNANYISLGLKGAGFTGNICAGYNLSYEDEEIISFRIGDRIEEPSDLGVLVVEIDVD